jgi:hypothetical protein
MEFVHYVKQINTKWKKEEEKKNKNHAKEDKTILIYIHRHLKEQAKHVQIDMQNDTVKLVVLVPLLLPLPPLRLPPVLLLYRLRDLAKEVA